MLNLKELFNPSGMKIDTEVKKQVVKIVLTTLFIKKYKKSAWVNIYNNFELTNEIVVDLYIEDLKDKSVKLYKILGKGMGDERRENLKELVEKVDLAFVKNKEAYLINIDEVPDSIIDMRIHLQRYI